MNRKSALREWGEAIFVGFLLAMFVRTFFVQAFKIPTGSMKPTLKPGDKILVEKITYGPLIPFTNIRIPGKRKPKRGDIIVFKCPVDKGKYYIKRLIGLGGETVLIKDGSIYINGKLVTIPQISKNFYTNEGVYGTNSVKVPKGYYFVLGDNSPSSYDSRFWGFVPEGKVIGKAWLIFWPPKRIRLLK